jgi:hypothetical protein
LWWVPGATTVLVIGGVIAVTLWQMHLNLLFTETTTTGGDTGAHIALPAYLQTLLSHGHLTGWDPGWYDGFSLYTFYFALPDLFAAIGGWVIPYDVAFKLVTVLGSVLLPVSAWACGRLFRLRPPIPTVLAAFTLPFLFDYTFTIYGGNLFSTLAGEYAYSFSLSLAVLFLGLFARAVREGTYRFWAAIVLAGCILSHIVPGMFALVGAAVLMVIELLPAGWRIGDDRVGLPWGRRQANTQAMALAPQPAQVVWRAASTVVAGVLLSGWWLVPFGIRQPYATSMGYQNLTNFWSLLFPEADAWALALAGVGVVLALICRSRFGLVTTAIGAASALGLVFDPQGSLYNVRLLPLWIIAVYLMAGWMVGVTFVALTQWWRRHRVRLWRAATTGPAWDDAVPVPVPVPVPMSWEMAQSSPALTPGPDTTITQGPAPTSEPKWPWAPAAVGGAIVAMVTVLAVVIPPFFISPAHLPVTVGANEVTNWSQYNYEGYQGQADYPEFKALMTTMQRLGRTDGCGRAMWEYSSSENRFGTPEALMLLPYETNNCIDSMEGLLFESSATTPYHFIDQSELSAGPSDPEVGLPYGPLDVTLGVQHLQLLGVKYFMAETPTVEAEAAADPSLKLVATTGPWVTDYNGQALRTTWQIYEVRDAALVTPLTDEPVVIKGIHPDQASWLFPALTWYADPEKWNVARAQSGPPSWPRVAVADEAPPTIPEPKVSVSHIREGLSSINFDVSRVGVPVLVKISYFPNWHAAGANGPWRVTPNLMVVVPTAKHVQLTYSTSTANQVGDLSTIAGLVMVVAIGWRARRRRQNPTMTTG